MTIGKISAASPGAPDAPGNFQGGQALKPHGKSIAPSLETSQSSPAGGSASTAFVTGEKMAAKKSAQRAGRPYPNLVDNMRMSGKTVKKPTRRARRVRKKSAKKPTLKRSSMQGERDPRAD